MVLDVNRKAVQQNLKEVISRTESSRARAKTGCGVQGKTTSGAQSSSALIGLLCSSGSTSKIPTPQACSTDAASGATDQPKSALPAEHSRPTASRECQSSSRGTATTRAQDTAAEGSLQQCPLCQQLLPTHALQEHINRELDGILTTEDSSQIPGAAAITAHASSRPMQRDKFTAARLPRSSKQSAVLDETGAHPETFRRRGGTACEQQGSQLTGHGRSRSGGLCQLEEPRCADGRGLRQQFGAAAQDMDRQLAHRAAGAANKGGYDFHQHLHGGSRSCAEEQGAKSGAGCRGVTKARGRGRQHPQRAEGTRRAGAPSSKVLVLGGDRHSEKDNPPKRAKAVVSRQTAAAIRFNHYSTGHGFWDSGMLGLDGAENMGAEMWEGLGTTAWSGLGAP